MVVHSSESTTLAPDHGDADLDFYRLSDPGAKRSAYLGLLGALQSHAFPQVHSLLSFIGQFLPLFLQPAGLSAAKDTVQSAATRIENKIFV